MPTTATHFNSATSTFFLLAIILLCFPGTTRTDNPCPYPCYPQPTGSGVTPTTPSVGGSGSPATSSGSTAPPQSGLPYPPPSGYYPYNPTPPYGGGSGGDGNNGGVYGTPPPPDPILPYFPFYYRKPPHKDASATSITVEKFSGTIATTALLSLLLLFV